MSLQSALLKFLIIGFRCCAGLQVKFARRLLLLLTLRLGPLVDIRAFNQKTVSYVSAEPLAHSKRNFFKYQKNIQYSGIAGAGMDMQG